jgi:hypothetical protein
VTGYAGATGATGATGPSNAPNVPAAEATDKSYYLQVTSLGVASWVEVTP